MQAVAQLSQKSVQKLGISSGEDTCGHLGHGVEPFRLCVIDICANGAHSSGMAVVTVVETPEFQRRARSLMSEAERLELIDFVARNPMTGCRSVGAFGNSVLPGMVAERVAATG